MNKKSSITRTIKWCYDNGKSFEYEGNIYNIDKIGADIHLNAIGSVKPDNLRLLWDEQVYYFNPKCDLSSMIEDKKYIVKLENGKMDVLTVYKKTPKRIYFTNGMCNMLDGTDCTVFAITDNDIIEFNEYKK